MLLKFLHFFQLIRFTLLCARTVLEKIYGHEKTSNILRLYDRDRGIMFPDIIMPKNKASIIFAIFGFLLIYLGISILELPFLAWIGVWIVVATLVYELYRWRKELKKEGKEIIL